MFSGMTAARFKKKEKEKGKKSEREVGGLHVPLGLARGRRGSRNWNKQNTSAPRRSTQLKREFHDVRWWVVVV
jgi:hypothetical protein